LPCEHLPKGNKLFKVAKSSVLFRGLTQKAYPATEAQQVPVAEPWWVGGVTGLMGTGLPHCPGKPVTP